MEIVKYQNIYPIYQSSDTIVYRATHDGDGTPVVLKMPKAEYSNATVITKYRHEYELLRELKGKGAINVYDLTKYQNRPVLVLQDFNAESLKDKIREEPFYLETRLDLAIRICECISEIHHQDVIHRNINPQNILVHTPMLDVKLIDFALSTRFVRDRQLAGEANQLEGTLTYLSPEQTGRMNRPIDYRTDIYSLGVTLYEMFTNVLPFQAKEPLKLVHAHIARQPVAPNKKNANVPRVLSDIVLKCMAKNPDDRYQSTRGIGSDLEKCLDMWKKTGMMEAFPLAQQDRVRTFNISKKLYGREMERNTIRKAFQRVKRGATEFVLLSGPEGSGKSALISDDLDTRLEKKSFQGKGACSPFYQSVPFSALNEALEQMVGTVLELRDAELAILRDKIHSTLGANAGILASLVPNLGKLIGPQTDASLLNGAVSKEALQITLRSFLSLIGNADNPIVLSFDDLQWADEDTLELFKSLVSKEPVSYLLVIGSYLEQELTDTHPLIAFLSSLRTGKAAISEQRLPMLNTTDIGNLLVDSFQLSHEKAIELAKILLDKTHGNPFFVHRILTDLYQSGQLSFDEDGDTWTWDKKIIDQMPSTTNVVDFMIDKIDEMSRSSQTVLMQAACIGERFDLSTLASVRNEDVQTTLAELAKPVQEGFVEQLRLRKIDPTDLTATVREDGLVFRFVHPRIRKTAYTQMPTAVKQKTHLHIAEFLSRGLTVEGKKERGYELADNFLAAVNLLIEEEERAMAVEAFQIAGKKAHETAAFETELRYLKAGVDLLPENVWKNQYEFAFSMHMRLIKSEYACGHYKQLIKLIKFVRAKCTECAAPLLDQLEVIGREMSVYVIQGQVSESKKLGTEALQLCGFNIPNKISRRLALRQYQVVKDLMDSKTMEDIIQLPTLEDPIIRIMIRLLMATSNGEEGAQAAFFFTKMAELALRHGLSSDSSLGFFSYLFLMKIDRKEDLEEAFEMGQLAMKIAERFQEARPIGNALLLFTGSLNHFHNHLRTTVHSFKGYYELLVSEGGISYAVFHSYSWSYARLACGDLLSDIADQADDLASQSKAHNMPDPTYILYKLFNTLIELQGLDTVRKVDNPSFTAKKEDNALKTEVALADSYMDCMQLYLLDHKKRALSAAMEGFRMMDARGEVLNFLLPELTFYQGLIFTSVYAESEEAEQKKFKRHLNRILRFMRVWAELCPDNYLHKSLLLQAEYRSLFGKIHQAADLYDEAIRSAREYGFIQNEAIANECAAKFYLSRNKEKVARAYLLEARYLYGEWGAYGKAKQLEKKYAHLMATSTARDSMQGPSLSASVSLVSGNLTQSLDLSTILKTSQAISSEIHLDKLLGTMLNLVVENAGAEKGYWILEDDDEWSIMASTDVNNQSGTIKPVPIDRTNQLAFGVVQYAIRTQEVIVLQNACREGRFVNDPYIRKVKAQSILCLPIIKQNNVIAILYLENNLATNTFTPERVELLRLLSGQAAISIENARMYEKLDQLVQERTEELRRTQQKMIESDKMASLGQLTAGVAHEINNPINFVVANANPLRQDIDDLLGVIASYESILKEHHLIDELSEVKEDAELEYVIEEIQQLLNGIEDGGKRTAEIVKGLRTFSRLDEDEVKKSSVIEGIDSTLTLLKKKAEPRIRIIRNYGDIPDIDCYPGKLNQVFMNLLSNAIQSIEGEGEIRLTIQRIGENVRIQISDTGVGMSEDVKRRIFEPFFTTKDVGVGTGLGLSISYGIIEKHKGSIEVDSVPGKGTTFTIILPIQQIDA